MRHSDRVHCEHFDDVAVGNRIRADVDFFTVDRNMAVVDKLARGEHGWHEFHAVDHGVQTALKNTDQVLRRVATAAHGFVIIATEFLLGDVAVVSLELLFSHQVGAVVGFVTSTLTVLSGAAFAIVDGAFGTSPKVDAEASIDLVLRFNTSAHLNFIPITRLPVVFVPIAPAHTH